MHLDSFIKDGSYFDENIEDPTHLGEVKDEDKQDIVVSFYFQFLDHGGQSTSVLEYLFRYMEIIVDKKFPEDYDGEWYVVMSVLERNNLIESGVSIRFPWLTERGQKAYEDMKEVM